MFLCLQGDILAFSYVALLAGGYFLLIGLEFGGA
jgi:hypothetical protein